jgi:hypothetical protein
MREFLASDGLVLTPWPLLNDVLVIAGAFTLMGAGALVVGFVIDRLTRHGLDQKVLDNLRDQIAATRRWENR